MVRDGAGAPPHHEVGRLAGIRPVYRHFRGEEFSLWRPWASKKTTAICGQNNGDIAIFAAVSTRHGGGATFKSCAGSFRGIKVPLAPQECSSCSKQFFYSGARRLGSAGVLPSSLRSPPPPCGMLAFDQATPVCAVASGVNFSEKHAPVGLRFSTVITAECSSAMRCTIESPSPVLPGLLRSRRQNR